MFRFRHRHDYTHHREIYALSNTNGYGITLSKGARGYAGCLVVEYAGTQSFLHPRGGLGPVRALTHGYKCAGNERGHSTTTADLPVGWSGAALSDEMEMRVLYKESITTGNSVQSAIGVGMCCADSNRAWGAGRAPFHGG